MPAMGPTSTSPVPLIAHVAAIIDGVLTLIVNPNTPEEKRYTWDTVLLEWRPV
jgi:hypothetical protein